MTRQAAALAIVAALVAGFAAGLSVRAAAPRSTPEAVGVLPTSTGAPLTDTDRPVTDAGRSGMNAGEASEAPSPAVAASPTPRPVTRVTPTPAPTRRPRTVTGIASTYGPGWDGWIAWPGGPGWRLRVCGAGGCRTVRSNDAGPDKAMQRRGRIVDLDVPTFEAVCGVPWTRGLCRVRVTVLGR